MTSCLKKNSDVIPLLLTSSIIPYDSGIQLDSVIARLHHAVESIEHWLNIDPELPIVLCDGSNFDLQGEVSRKFPNAIIEFLKFENNQNMVRIHGRGYGEGEILRYALENSKLIKKAGCFAKCSSKLWVENFKRCIKLWNEKFLCKPVFHNSFSLTNPTVLHHIDTRFYIASKSFYEEHFLFAHHQINSHSGYGLEECFHKIIIEKKLDSLLFTTPPIISGVGGGTGFYYKNPKYKTWQEILKIRLARKNPKFNFLF